MKWGWIAATVAANGEIATAIRLVADVVEVAMVNNLQKILNNMQNKYYAHLS